MSVGVCLKLRSQSILFNHPEAWQNGFSERKLGDFQDSVVNHVIKNENTKRIKISRLLAFYAFILFSSKITNIPLHYQNLGEMFLL